MAEQITASPEFRESRVFKSSVSKADEGVYQCETGNVYGSGVAKFSQVQVITRTTVNIVNSAAGLEGKFLELKILNRYHTSPKTISFRFGQGNLGSGRKEAADSLPLRARSSQPHHEHRMDQGRVSNRHRTGGQDRLWHGRFHHHQRRPEAAPRDLQVCRGQLS